MNTPQITDAFAIMLVEARHSIADTVEETGGCDHSVNVCSCADASLVSQIDEKLIEAFGPKEFIRLHMRAGNRAPDGRAGDEARRKAWGDRATAAVKQYAAEWNRTMHAEWEL